MTAHRTLLPLFALAACGGGGAAPDATSPDGQEHDAAVDAAADAAPLVCPTVTRVMTASAAELTITGDTGSTIGLAAPSFAGTAMSYTSFAGATDRRTRIATSSDAGATWTYASDADAPAASTITSSDQTECPLGQCAGTMISVASALVDDASEPDARVRWKLFAQRYLVSADGTAHARYGTITLATAPSPDGPWTAPSPWLGWDSPSPSSSAGVALDVSTIPALADCTALSAPGAVAIAGRIDLALGCRFDGATGPRTRVVLLSSSDHGASFGFVSNLLGPGDAACLGGASIDEPDLFVTGGIEYVDATAIAGAVEEGCLVWPIDSAGAEPVRALAASPARATGGCATDDALGYVVPVVFTDAPPREDRLFASTVPAP